MLCVKLKSYSAPCGATSGGVSDIWVYDPSDFNFTQTTTDGSVNPYSAIALRTGAVAADGAKMFRINFQRKEAELKFTHSRNGCSVKYSFELSAQLPNLSHDLTNFLKQLDSAGCCCGLGLIVHLNSGKIFVLGEKYVNDEAIPYFEVVMDGSEGTSGKVYEDFNGVNVLFKGDYSRAFYEYSGGIQSIIDLE